MPRYSPEWELDVLFECISQSEERLVYKELTQRGADSEVKPRRLIREQYVLHWLGRSQEDDQLLRERGQRADSFGRRTAGDASGTGQLDENTPAALGRSDGSNYFHWLDIRSPATPRG